MKIRYLCCVLLMLVFACKKNTTTKPPEFKFTAVYDSVITAGANSTFSFSFTINVTSGDISQNHLTCSIKGVPANVTMAPDSLNVSTIMSGQFSFTAGDVPVGTDTLQFVVHSTKYGDQVHNLYLKITAPPDNAPLLAGTYAASYDYCLQPDSFYHYTSVVTTVADTMNLVKITNIKNFGSGFVVRAWVTSAVAIPFQSVGSYKIWGTGTFTHDSNAIYHIIINDTLVNGVDTEWCVVHVQH